MGGAVGTALAGSALRHVSATGDFFWGLIPVVMAGIVSIYGLVLAVVIKGRMGHPPGGVYTLVQ